MKRCLCGCGTKIPNKDSRGRIRRFVQGHQKRYRLLPRLKINCKCGCDGELLSVDSKNRPRLYIRGHATRTRKYPEGFFDYLKGNSWGYKKGHSPWNKDQKWPEMTGENNPAWNNGSSKDRGDRADKRYRPWRRAILERDNYRCTTCGVTEGRLDVDHIKSFKDYPELRWELSNGRVLCWDCHKKTPTYGYRGKK